VGISYVGRIDMIETYKDALDFMTTTSWQEKKRGLERIGELCVLLDNPQDKVKYIHVAGTNGKGSVCAVLDSVFRSAGLVTGLFTSPHLIKYNERIKVNGEDISDEDFISIANRIQQAAVQMEDAPTVFEKLTAAAFIYFEMRQCEIAILETGMGGEFDSTNIIRNPVLCIITAIGLDHTKELGDTLEEIARTKAGIVKKNVPCVCLDQDEEINNAIHTKCMIVDAPCIFAKTGTVKKISSDFYGIRIMTSSVSEPVSVSLCGEYQMKNLAIALTALRVLIVTGKMSIGENDIIEGLRNVSWPGRFEVIRQNPFVIVDGAHNPHGMKAFCDSLKTFFLNKGIIYVTAMNRDKDINGMINIMASNATKVFTVSVDEARGEDPAILAQNFKSVGVNALSCDNVEEALSKALDHAGLNDVICCVGSIYLVGAVRQKDILEIIQKKNLEDRR